MNKLSLFNRFDDDDNNVPVHVQEAIENYLINGFEPGGFLTAILTNNLFQAVRSADFVNKRFVGSITKWILTNAPDNSYGSFNNISKWINDEDMRRTNYVAKISKEQVWRELND